MLNQTSVALPRSAPNDQWPPEGLESLGCCPVCGVADRTILYKGLKDRVFFCAPGEWTMHRCRKCGTGYLDPRPTAETISLAYSSYFTHHALSRPSLETMTAARRWQRSLANGYRNWRFGLHDRPATKLGVAVMTLFPASRARLDTVLRHMCPPFHGARLLDVGCGEGAFLEWARAAGWEAVGVEPDPAAVAAARSRGLTVHAGTVEALRSEASSFDVVTLSHVLEHVHDPRALLKSIRDLLKPGGLLWLDTPNITSVGCRLFGANWLGLDPPRHLVLFNHPTLRSLLESLGFTVIRRFSRFEVCGLTFGMSERIANGSRDPLGETARSFAVRMRGYAASWLVRINRDRSEFITLIAKNAR
jgi:2-polyprenyl-3-methyl-5-hydroxy-6-metoxy-1,4-benzoquinol methylase